MTFGVTPTGFNLKTLADILPEVTAALSLIQDPVSGEFLSPDFSGADPSMQIILTLLQGIETLWQALQAANDQFIPANASGNILSALVQFAGIERNPATQSLVSLDVTGTPALVISAGQIVSDSSGVSTWLISEEFTFSGGGSASVTALAVIFGAISAPSGTINTIVNPTAGWDTVTNPLDAVPGVEEENDVDLRRRFAISKLAPASAPSEAVEANLLDVAGVTRARVRINNTLDPDGDGIPGKSLAAVVSGGENEDIAKTLLQRTGITAEFFGTTMFNLFDNLGNPVLISWFRPTPVEIFVEVDITITDPGISPSNRDVLIKQAILDYAQIGGEAFGTSTSFSQFPINPGETVVLSRLYTPVNSIQGHKVNSLQIGLSVGTLGILDIPVAFNELANFQTANITIITT